MVNNFLFCVCVCVLQVTWRANGIVLYMYEGNVLMDINIYKKYLMTPTRLDNLAVCVCPRPAIVLKNNSNT